MSQPPGPIHIPPFKNVRLIECRDFMALAPVPAYREFFAYGKIKAREVRVNPDDPNSEVMWDDLGEDEDVWTVVQWWRFEDGHEEEGTVSYLRPPATEDDARAEMKRMTRFYSKSKEEMLALMRCYKTTEDDHLFIENRYPNYQSLPSGLNATDAQDLYHARLKVLAGLHPKTVELIRKADALQDAAKRQALEREAVQAYFAELAHYWSEDEVLAWQRANPVGTEWIREFAHVIEEPVREVDPINYELAFNWLRQKYNLLTAEELSDSVLEKTLQRLMPETLKKRRERLGLTTKRPPGPPPNASQ